MKTVSLIMSVLLVFTLSGCASMSKRSKCAVGGALAGAVIGGGAGVAISHQGDTMKRTEGSAIGAAAGALIGGLIGYFVCKEEVPVVAQVPEPVVEKEEVPPPPPAPKVVEKIVLNAIQFDFDSAVIKPKYYPVLDEGIHLIQKHPEKQIVIEGHTCSIGDERYNMGLSMRRAQSVKSYMVEKGVDAARLTVEGYGEERPVADNATRAGREMNRRVEFKVMNGE